MKQKISVSIDEEKLAALENLLDEGTFRSKSHIIEYSLKNFLDSLSHPTSKNLRKVGDLTKFLKETENERL